LQKNIGKQTSMSIKAVLFDWAGTTVDYGSRAPVEVFLEIFRRMGIDITEAEARGPMGQAKRQHIASVLSLPRISQLWESKFGAAPCLTKDVDRLYANFLPLQLAVLAKGSNVLPGIPEMVATLRSRGIKIGSSTGYTRALMEAVIPNAREQGYEPDVVVCSDDAAAGRPMPWLNFRACEALGVCPPSSVLVVDDTPIGIQAARNAGMWCVGVSMTGNGLGLSQSEVESMPTAELAEKLSRLETEYKSAGAHFVLRSAADLLPVLDEINGRIAKGMLP
jgi:phosphonoacetaldehyde hydrolase